MTRPEPEAGELPAMAAEMPYFRVAASASALPSHEATQSVGPQRGAASAPAGRLEAAEISE